MFLLLIVCKGKSNASSKILTLGCSHNPTSQKGVKPLKKSQMLINIYVLSFKAMAIMASYCFFIDMNVKEFKPKIHLMKF
jgi:hypothetical protein